MNRTTPTDSQQRSWTRFEDLQLDDTSSTHTKKAICELQAFEEDLDYPPASISGHEANHALFRSICSDHYFQELLEKSMQDVANSCFKMSGDEISEVQLEQLKQHRAITRIGGEKIIPPANRFVSWLTFYDDTALKNKIKEKFPHHSDIVKHCASSCLFHNYLDNVNYKLLARVKEGILQPLSKKATLALNCQCYFNKIRLTADSEDKNSILLKHTFILSLTLVQDKTHTPLLNDYRLVVSCSLRITPRPDTLDGISFSGDAEVSLYQKKESISQAKTQKTPSSAKSSPIKPNSKDDDLFKL